MPLQWWKAALSHSHLQSCHSSFFVPKVLIQSPAQANNFKFPAMASPRRVIFLILVRICLPAHERASGWPQSGGSHNSDAEICRSGPCCMHPSGKHLPTGCRSETDISLTRTVSAVRVSDSAAGSGPVGLSLWASRGLAWASAAATRSASSASRQALPYLYIAYDVKTNNVGVNRMFLPI